MWQALCVVGRKIAGIGNSGGGGCSTNNNSNSNCLPVIVLQSTSKLPYNNFLTFKTKIITF
jgi:hypothetical protein